MHGSILNGALKCLTDEPVLMYLNQAEAKGGEKITFKRLVVEMFLFSFSLCSISPWYYPEAYAMCYR